jgi:drug/metabolite transporter (DMT)-like permease
MERPQKPVIGIFWMVVTGLCFVAVTAIVKHVGPSLPSSQSAFLRYAIGTLFLLPVLPGLLRSLPGAADLRLFMLRGAFHSLGVILWFYGMTQLSIAEVTAMNYVSPVYVTLGAALFLGERLALRRTIAVVVALAGTVIILRPGVRALGTGHVAMIFAPMALAGSYLIMKRLSDRFEPAVVVFMLSAIVTVALIPFAWAVWVPPTLTQLAWLVGVALFATTAHYTMTLAFRAAPVAVTQPVTFLQLVWATVMGVVIFGEPVDAYVVLGGAVILGSVSFMTWREAVMKRRALTPPNLATGA